MSKMIYDRQSVEELLTRGVEKIYPSREKLMARLLKGERLRLYCGYDPTAPALHIGNAITLNKLSQFQALGHEVIFLVGDFTGLIGDPTDKKAARRQLTRADILANAKDYKRQVAAYLRFNGPNPAQLKYNSSWNSKLKFTDLISLSSHFTVQQMIQRDMFQERLKEEKPIYLHEFLYPLVQAYDSVVMDVDLEIGGNDQMFNMMCGRDLVSALKKKDKFIMTLKLLTDDAGQKMGKSEGNAVFLDTPADDMYGRVMTWPDGIIYTAFEMCTRYSFADLQTVARDLKKGLNPRDLKMKLAWEITKMNHGVKAADQAQAQFIKTFQKKELPDEIKFWRAGKSNYILVELLVLTKLASSKTEARRFLEQGSVKIIDGENISVPKDVQTELLVKNGLIISRGKRNFIKIKL